MIRSFHFPSYTSTSESLIVTRTSSKFQKPARSSHITSCVDPCAEPQEVTLSDKPDLILTSVHSRHCDLRAKHNTGQDRTGQDGGLQGDHNISNRVCFISLDLFYSISSGLHAHPTPDANILTNWSLRLYDYRVSFTFSTGSQAWS